MALSLDPATRVISVPQADLTFVSGALYTLDSNQFRKDVFDLLASENYIWMPDAFNHNTEVTVAGVTYARTLEFINGYSVTFEDTGGAYTVRIEGSNNNIFDVENGILNPTSLVTIISTNSAGLQIVTQGSGLDPTQDAQLTRIHDLLDVIEGSLDHGEVMRILLAAAAGKLSGAATTNVKIRDQADTKDRIDATVDADGNRTSVTVDAT